MLLLFVVYMFAFSVNLPVVEMQSLVVLINGCLRRRPVAGNGRGTNFYYFDLQPFFTPLAKSSGRKHGKSL
jgi:hypothetical protein